MYLQRRSLIFAGRFRIHIPIFAASDFRDRVYLPRLFPTRNRSGNVHHKNNFYTLYDLAMLGFTSHSKVPLRLAAMLGFVMSFLSMLVAVGYFIYKLLFWCMLHSRDCSPCDRVVFILLRPAFLHRHTW